MFSPDLFKVRFNYAEGQPTAEPMYYALAFLLEKHIDNLEGGIPDYFAEAIGCKQCPAIKMGKKCLLNRESGPAPGIYAPGQDIPRYFKFKCSGQEEQVYTPCMQGFEIGIDQVHMADMHGVRPMPMR
jgi:hypothetical protein